MLRKDLLYALNVTNAHTDWIETKVAKYKAQVQTFNTLKEIRRMFPVKVLSIDSDNGSEFINTHLLNYCKREYITFIPLQPCRKN